LLLFDFFPIILFADLASERFAAIAKRANIIAAIVKRGKFS
jgi:general stress protein CsbA